ncbi:MAG: hypothetical protein K0R54_194 [Clostridiaceae bacterium]|nr:hypothetical protein [Clostridiaceae bacterium]
MEKDIRLKKFYETLDNLYCENVKNVKNANEVQTKERIFDLIYNEIIKTEDFKFLTSDFIKQEINKYYDDTQSWWADIKKLYKI